jgi:hypothetical protein
MTSPYRACPVTGFTLLPLNHHSIGKGSKKDRRPAIPEKNTHMKHLNPALNDQHAGRVIKKPPLV